MKKLIVVGVALLMSGCAAKVTDIPTGHGQGHLVECSGGMFSSWARCYRKADEVCEGKGFTVDNPQSNPNTFGAALVFGTTMDRSMVIQCYGQYEVEEDDGEADKFVR